MACDSPFYVPNPDYPHISNVSKVPVPCGKCPPCQLRRVSSWVYRLQREEEVSTSSFFVTLTYDTTYVPITSKGYMTLDKRDVQLFMKRLRKLHDKHVRLKYYLAGEYGGKTERPHYHLILFNADVEKIHDAWGLGQVHVGQVTGSSIAYTCKYISKEKRIPMHKNDDRLREFSLMSKRLGANFFTPARINYHKADLSRNFLVVEGGSKIALPRYYRDRIYSESERKAQARLIADIVTQDDLILKGEFLRLYPGGDFDRHKESARIGRYESFYKHASKRDSI